MNTTEYKTIDTSIPVAVYPDELKLLLKVINRALDADYLNEEEIDKLVSFKDDFVDVVMEHAE